MAAGAQTTGAPRTREALLDAGAALAEEHGLAGVSVNMVVARAGVAKGTFYVHFKDRAAFVDAMHERFHARVQAAVSEAIAGLPPGAQRLLRSAEVYLDISLANRGVKALAHEARSDPTVQDTMAARRDRLAAASVVDLRAMGWDDAEAAAQLLAAVTREISVLEFDAGCPLPASRRVLKRFLGLLAPPSPLPSGSGLDFFRRPPEHDPLQHGLGGTRLGQRGDQADAICPRCALPLPTRASSAPC